MRPTSGDPWAPYVPDEGMPWNLRRVVHLHRRAGFAATWDEIRRDLNDGPEASIDRLLEGTSRSCGVPAGFAAFADRLADRALAAPDSSRLKGPTMGRPARSSWPAHASGRGCTRPTRASPTWSTAT